LPSYLAGGVAVYGDSRSGHDAHRRIVEGIERINPAAVFHTGDLVNNGAKKANWKTFNEITADLQFNTPFYPAIGNHEKPNDPSTLYFEQFDLPGNERWYTKDINGISFVVLDTDSSLAVGSDQYEWLNARLESMDAHRTIAVVFHYPPFSTGNHGGDEKGLKYSIVPLFEKHDVDLVFSGHDHNYERSMVNGIHYLVTGGGGAPIRKQARKSPESQLFIQAHHFCVIYREGGKLMVDVWSSDVLLIDQFVVDVP
jgi:3',5'-cyclic AMP phosphodiesterase CpdA